MKTKHNNEKLKDLNTMDILNEMMEIQIKKINTFSNGKPKNITKESELAMKNMIELIKLRYDIIHNTK